MIDKTELEDFIAKQLEGTDLYPVEISVGKDNVIKIELDSDSAVDIDECVRLTREIEQHFDRDADDYELEVGSAGITSPLRVPRQYKRYLGKELELLTADGKKLTGLLTEAGPESFTIEREVKVKKEGAKRPVMEKETLTFGYGDVKQAKYLLKF